jgi:pimeloyl-ACP methyl ester carboxylesterase
MTERIISGPAVLDNTEHPAIILVPGHWLGAWAWDEVVARLKGRGFDPLALTLPGLDPDDAARSSRTLDDQAGAVVDALTRAHSQTGSGVVLVGHSGANAPISIALDRRPELVRRVIWVDSGPVADGGIFDPEAPEDLTERPLPDFEVLAERASLRGLDAEALDRFRRRAVAEPGKVLRTPVRLSNEARRDVPTTLICTSIPSGQILAMASAGHPMVAEVAAFRDVTAVDLPTGHWPMWSRPAELVDLIVDAIEDGG